MSDQKYITVEEFEKFKKSVMEGMTKEKKPKAKREPSNYNIFIKEKISLIKKNKPEISHKDAFSEAVAMYNKEKESKREKKL